MSATRWKSIVVVVTRPFAREQVAAAKAAAIARRCGARVVLFNSFMIPQPVNDVPMDSREQIIESAIRQRRERLAKIAVDVGLPGATECVVRWDFPIYASIVRYVQESEPDLLIADSHREGRLARMVLANTDWELIRQCPCPLWFVRSPELARAPRLLVAVDPRHTHAKPARLDDRLLQAARGMTRQLGGSFSLAHAYEAWSPKSLELGANAAEAVGRLAKRHRVVAADCSVREGSASAVLPAEATRQHADVLVMGAVSRSLLERPVIGNTAERVIDQVDCDVFVVKPAGFKSQVSVAKRKSACTTLALTGASQ
jgi:universal stress protein E